jgi:hypothetical protein
VRSAGDSPSRIFLKKDNIVGTAAGESLCEDGSVSLDVSNSGRMISLSNGSLR